MRDIQFRNQEQFSIHVWAGIIGDVLADPHVFSRNTDREWHCYKMIVSRYYIFTLLAIREHMNGSLHYRLIIIGYIPWLAYEPTVWPPCSADLHPIHFICNNSGTIQWQHYEADLCVWRTETDNSVVQKAVAAVSGGINHFVDISVWTQCHHQVICV